MYAKEDLKKELPYAVKCLKTDCCGEEVSIELLSLLKLDHPNIIKYHATYEDREQIYFVMEFCPDTLYGRDL